MAKKRNKKYKKIQKTSLMKKSIFQQHNILTKNSENDQLINADKNMLEKKDVSSMIKIAIEIWKIEKKLNKIKGSH